MTKRSFYKEIVNKEKKPSVLLKKRNEGFSLKNKFYNIFIKGKLRNLLSMQHSESLKNHDKTHIIL